MATLAERLQAEIDRANSTTSKIDTTVHDAVGSLISGYGTGGIDGIDANVYEWNQMPTLVKNFLDSVSYDSSDYSVSHIAEYAPSKYDKSNTYPVGASVEISTGTLNRHGYELEVSSGTVDLVNDVPNQYTEYTVRNNGEISQVGALKPTGFLRQIKCNALNVRDLGGWPCDGGTIKYGKLFRGGNVVASDQDVFVNQLGIRQELDLRGKNEAENATKSLLGDEVGYTCTDTYTWYSLSNTEDWKTTIRCVFNAVKKNEPLYFHCLAGADRTGTVACILEAILGVSQSDIDKDYELTCFALGTDTDDNARRRNETEWTGLINQITALTIGDTFRDKIINWVASLGFTVDEINAFRNVMIDGTPDTITLDIGAYTVTNTLSNVTTDGVDSVDKYQPYEANITPSSGYAISNVKVTMGGIDVTNQVFTGTKTTLNRSVSSVLSNCELSNTRSWTIDGQGYVADIIADAGYKLDAVTVTMGGVDVSTTYYENGKIAIPNVTGDIVITATAVESVTPIENLVESYGVAEGERISITSGENRTLAGCCTVGATNDLKSLIPYTAGDVFRIKGATWTSSEDSSIAFVPYSLDGTHISSSGAYLYIGMSDVINISFDYDEENNIGILTTKHTNVHTNTCPYMRLSLKCSDVSQLIITKNQEIV